MPENPVEESENTAHNPQSDIGVLLNRTIHHLPALFPARSWFKKDRTKICLVPSVRTPFRVPLSEREGLFSPGENRLDIPMHASKIFRARIQNLPELVLFLEGVLKEAETREGESFDILLAADEIFTNIASYAYGEGSGEVEIALTINDDSITIIFTDSGIPFNPLSLQSPDITRGIDERKIGGLGIHLVREIMDAVSYLRKDGKNILTIEKKREKMGR